MSNVINLHLKKRLFNEVYFPLLLDYSHKFEVYYGGSGSGKSHFIVQKLIVKLCRSRRRLLVIRKTGNSLKESCWKLFIDILSQWQLYPLCKVNKTDMTIELPNGSQILFKGLDDPEKIKSIAGITDCWCEEATELNEEDWEQLTLRVRERVDNLQFFASFNPISKANWVFKKWFADDAVIDEDTIITKTTYKDNRFLPPDYIRTLENKMATNPTYYRIYALGEFCSLDKLVYTNWSIEDFDYHTIKGEMMCGLDFGFVNDLTAFVSSIIDEDKKKIYIFKCWGEKGLTNDEIAKVITSLGFAKSLIIADSAEQKSIEELRRNGLYRVRPSVKGKDSINQGISKLKEYQLVVHPDCQGIITELENYAWQKDKATGKYINTPIDMFNHYLDALRYSLQCVGKSLKTLSKSALGL